MVSGKKSNSRKISPHLIGTPVPPLHAASPFRMSGTQKRRRGRRENHGVRKKMEFQNSSSIDYDKYVCAINNIT